MRTWILVPTLALACVLIGCSASHSASSMKGDGDGGDGDGARIHQLRPGQDLFLAWRSLCTTGKPVTITKVIHSPTHTTVVVADWGTHYIPPGEIVDNEPRIGTGPISQIPGFGHHPVTAVCGQTSAMNSSSASG